MHQQHYLNTKNLHINQKIEKIEINEIEFFGVVNFTYPIFVPLTVEPKSTMYRKIDFSGL